VIARVVSEYMPPCFFGLPPANRHLRMSDADAGASRRAS
jgi:hypothetical protein